MKHGKERAVISVIMLTYNRKDFLVKSITSILNQTYKDFEFIVIDNGSTDGGGFIADEYASNDPRMRVLHLDRGSIGSRRNIGIDYSEGDYITFIDDDDWAEPDYLAFLKNLLEGTESDMAICGAFDKIFDECKVMNPEEALVELMWRKKYNMAFPTKLFKKELFGGNRFEEKGIFDDISLMYKMVGNSRKIVYHGQPKYTFRRHGGNNSAWTTNHALINPPVLNEYLKAYRDRTEWICKKFPTIAEDARYFEWSFMISMIEKIERYHLSDCHDIEDKMKMILKENEKTFLNYINIKDFEKQWMNLYVVNR